MATVRVPAVSTITRGPVGPSGVATTSDVVGIGLEGELIIGVIRIEAVQVEQVGISRRLMGTGDCAHSGIQIGRQR